MVVETGVVATQQMSRVLARFVSNTSFEDLPEAVIREARRGFIDTIGVALAAVAEEGSRPILQYVRQFTHGGRSAVLGQNWRTTPPLAALANGTLAHLLDFDDVHVPMGGHPSAALVPAVLAVADEENASGADLILAYAVGFEVMTKLARVINPLHYTRGWHPTAVLSVFGTAAAACSLLRLGEAETVNALSVAASLCSGIRGNFGTLTKPLHVGHAAQSGVQAAYLAKRGHTANAGVFEVPMGFLDLFCSNDPADWKTHWILERLGEPWELADPGITFKPYPCCGSIHAVIDGHLALREQHPDLTPARIRRIRNGIHARRLPHTNRPNPISGLEGKFSNQFATALCWLKGGVRLEHFTDEHVHDPSIRAFMDKVEVYADPEVTSAERDMAAVRDPGLLAVVTLELDDGSTLSHRVAKRRGTPQLPLTDQELMGKFASCAGRIHRDAWIKTVTDVLRRLEALPSVSELSRHFAMTPTAV